MRIVVSQKWSLSLLPLPYLTLLLAIIHSASSSSSSSVIASSTAEARTRTVSRSEQSKRTNMAAVAALTSSMSSLSLTTNSFLGERLSPSFFSSVPVKSPEKPCLIFARLKRWERKKCKPNSLPILHKMHVKVGDTVKVIAGRDKGKVGEITKIFKHNSTVVVKEINLKTKHVKSREEGEQGQIIKIEAPVHSSNVMLYSKDQEVASRVGHKVLDDGKWVRYLIKTGEIIDSAENWKKLKESKEKTEVAAAAAAAS